MKRICVAVLLCSGILSGCLSALPGKGNHSDELQVSLQQAVDKAAPATATAANVPPEIICRLPTLNLLEIVSFSWLCSSLENLISLNSFDVY